MKHNNRWMAMVLVVVGLLLAACAPRSAGAVKKSAPAKVEPIAGTKLSRLTLTAEAAKRLDIQTAPVREEPVTRKRKVGGKVMAQPEGAAMTTGGTLVSSSASGAAGAAPDVSGVLVSVTLNESDLDKVDRGQPALILSIASGDKSPGLMAHSVAAPMMGDSEEAAEALYYAVDSAAPSLAPGQRVLVELTLLGSGARHKVIPYAAVIYDQSGATWAYTNPESLVFIRQPIVIDYIEGDRAVLSDGPAAGAAVVTVGGAELFGAETGVGK